jgi:hypothetical protein
MRLGTAIAVLSIAPITIFALATVGRLLQPLPNEPAGTEERIYEWFISLPASAVVFLLIALPMLAVATAAAVLWHSWRADQDLRADTRQAAVLGWRFLRRPTVWLAAAVVLVGLLLGIAIVVHGITG